MATLLSRVCVAHRRGGGKRQSRQQRWLRLVIAIDHCRPLDTYKDIFMSF
jgi:hypothetical protein